MTRKLLTFGLLAAGLMACGDDGDSGPTSATASFVGTNGQTVSGTATFTKTTSVSLTVAITAAPVGVHGMHIHMNPACGMEGMDAGPHWDDVDTGATNHHLPPTDGHLGDLGNITVAADGTGTLTFSNAAWTLGDDALTDVVPHAIIFHQLMDDGMMPSSGARWGCALITVAN